MPGTEIFTISGFGAPSGYDPTTGEPVDTAAAVSKSSAPPAVQLQNALKALGVTNGDPALSKLTVNGVIGPATVKAVNYTLAKYIGATKYFPAANLDVTKVRQYAAGLAGMVVDRVHKSGGTVPPPVVQHPVRRVSAGPAIPYSASEQPESLMDKLGANRNVVFWTVGGISFLVLLAAAASSVKKRRQAVPA